MMFCNGSPNAPNAFLRCATASLPNMSCEASGPCRKARSCPSLLHSFSAPGLLHSRREWPEGNSSCLAGLFVRLYDDLDIAVEAGQECDQTIDGIFTEVALEHAGHFGLADAHELAGPCLRELAL